VSETTCLFFFLSECQWPVSGRSVFWHLTVCALWFSHNSHLSRILLGIH
jgi:hypothetical protein